ncbi:hypothetical protein LDJ79_00980 [Vibrio tritonius]|uniref:Uncharacterized protein n=2 Tax=Vibrio tritonius TaxID=1435069 RepID=A0ABS7YG70_9VIBR|nr:hypothetical protein [Vibrio tritonius]MCA2014663.1 hypothetical protein [Vibrio tritonius]
MFSVYIVNIQFIALLEARMNCLIFDKSKVSTAFFEKDSKFFKRFASRNAFVWNSPIMAEHAAKFLNSSRFDADLGRMVNNWFYYCYFTPITPDLYTVNFLNKDHFIRDLEEYMRNALFNIIDLIDTSILESTTMSKFVVNFDLLSQSSLKLEDFTVIRRASGEVLITSDLKVVAQTEN